MSREAEECQILGSIGQRKVAGHFELNSVAVVEWENEFQGHGGTEDFALRDFVVAVGFEFDAENVGLEGDEFDDVGVAHEEANGDWTRGDGTFGDWRGVWETMNGKWVRKRRIENLAITQKKN
ncbi:hypothetical protein U1Q18_021340 [Sarracenia purpurea var. burkii]